MEWGERSEGRGIVEHSDMEMEGGRNGKGSIIVGGQRPRKLYLVLTKKLPPICLALIIVLGAGYQQSYPTVNPMNCSNHQRSKICPWIK